MLNKVLGIDLGSKTMGVAIGDSFTVIATGLEVFKFKDNHYIHALNHLVDLIDKYNIKEVVIGYPKNMDNSESKFSKRCVKFRDKLALMTDIPIHLYDERMTTKMASHVLGKQNIKQKNQKEHVDKVAATLILQSYLDSKRRENNGR